MPIKSAIETVSPQQADNWMKFNPHNRPIRWNHVEAIKQDILAGRWFVTHQGIAFGTDGNLIDGQHRLLAIQASGRPVQMMVTRGIEAHVNGDVNLYAMDVIDCGKRRTTGDQLNLIHGIANANLTVAALRRIIFICASDQGRIAVTTTKAVPLVSIFGEQIERMIQLATSTKIGRKAGVVGVLSFAYPIEPAVCEEFMTNLCSGDGITSSDPVYHLREYIISKGAGSGDGNTQERFAEMVANAFVNTVRGTPLKMLKAGNMGIDFLRSKQRGNVEKVRAILGYRK